MSAKINRALNEIELNRPVLAKSKSSSTTDECLEELETAVVLGQWPAASELQFMPNPYYLYSLQPAVTPQMRAILLDWMFEVSSEFALKRPTVYLAVSLLDRFLSVYPNILKEKFQLVGLVALFTAAKYEELAPPSLQEWLRTASYGYSREEVKATERLLLHKLQWRLASSTACTVLNWLMSEWETKHSLHLSFKQPNRSSYKQFRQAMQVLDAVLMDANSLVFPPSVLACSVFLLQVASHLGHMRAAESLCAEFFSQRLGLASLEPLREALEFLRPYCLLETSKQLPKVCQTTPREQIERHYEEFLSYQTYSGSNLEFVKQVLRRTL